jgi:hypothetical protein
VEKYAESRFVLSWSLASARQNKIQEKTRRFLKDKTRKRQEPKLDSKALDLVFSCLGPSISRRVLVGLGFGFWVLGFRF